MYCYEIKLSNNEDFYFYTEDDSVTLDYLKYKIVQNDWIKLTKHDREYEVQTCNIVRIYRSMETEACIEGNERRKQERLALIKQIDEYEFNFKMKLWLWWRDIWVYTDENNEHKLLKWNKEFLENMLDRCEKYKCKKY